MGTYELGNSDFKRQVSAQTLTGPVAWVSCFKLPMPQFPHLPKRASNYIYPIGLD